MEHSEGRRLFDKLRGDVLVVRLVDRLGRNYDDVCETIRDFMRRGVVIKTVMNGMTFDGVTQDPVQKAVRDALIAFMAATAKHRPKQRKPLSGLVLSTPRPRAMAIAGASRATRASNSASCRTCSANAPTSSR